ncbi:PadR family transcriptional regulator [Herbiconiux sp. A18JL235]|uniref:PadR family transcriptional regulator n=1 Tax=Herbiconiux sp. A18JL235 TaxID=3152363 RepID=A0AB39BFY4_9MICO
MQRLARITPATVDVLSVLLHEPGPVWGLLLVKATGRPAGSVYPILERLEGAGWATSVWDNESERAGPRRRLYELTGEGADAARAAIAHHEVVARRRAEKGAASGHGVRVARA